MRGHRQGGAPSGQADLDARGAAKANVESAIIYGLSSILHERLTIKDGVVEQSNFHDYNVMRMSDLPEEINVRFVEVDTRPTGLGEIGNHSSQARSRTHSIG
jgi:CO/xanthine dehydrogenase Mo-binding subunit